MKFFAGHIRGSSRYFLLLFVALLFASCKVEDLYEPDAGSKMQLDEDEIFFISDYHTSGPFVSTESVSSTKSVSSVWGESVDSIGTSITVPVSDTSFVFGQSEDCVMQIVKTVSERDDSFGPELPLLTKGVPVTTATLASNYGTSGINIGALMDRKKYFPDGNFITCSSSVWTTNIKEYWPLDKSAPIDFFLWGPKTGNGSFSDVSYYTLSEPYSLSFRYSMVAPGSPDASGNYQDSKKTDDVLVGGAFGKTRDNSASGVSFAMKHTMATLRFKVRKSNAGTFKSIALEDLKSSAKCTYSKDGTIVWSDYSNPKTYRQSYNVELVENFDPTLTTPLSNDEQGTVFMVIPQNAGAVKLTTTFRRVGSTSDENFTVTLSGTWDAGKIYTYSINVLGGYEISVESSCPSVSMVENAISNIGRQTCYVRAAVVANWVVVTNASTGEDEIVQEWNTKVTDADAGFTRASNWDTYWVYESNEDLYYYRKPLKEGEETKVKLFESYEQLTAGRESGSKLKFSVMAQAVACDAGKATAIAAWGATAAGYLETE